MSYCRWSSMDYTCDLYCYADVHGGWTTHVASSRVDWGPKGPPLNPMGLESYELITSGDHAAWSDLNARYHTALEERPRHPIGLAHDGHTFRDDDLEGFLETLIMLRDVGYRFPEDLLDEIREEISEQAHEETPGEAGDTSPRSQTP